MKKIKLLHIQLLPLLSGAQNVMLNLLTSLDMNKYDIYVISKPGGPLVDKLKQLNYHYIHVKSLRRNISFLDIFAFLDIYKICKRYKFDIVHTHSSKTGFIGRIAARLAKVPKIIHTVHGFPFHPFQPKIIQFFYMTMEKIASEYCDKVVFVNNSEREMAVKKNIVLAEKAITIFNGIQLPELSNIQKRDNLKDYFVIGSVSRFSRQKNILNVIKVAINVCKKTDIIKFVFIGDGELFSKCRKMVESENLLDRILLPGWQSNVIEWLFNFNVFLLYSKWEGLPVSILEAMSVGLPIVASNIKGNNELVNDSNGLLISINDIDKLEEVLISLPDKLSELSSLGKNSRKMVEEKFNIKDFLNNYKKLYE